MKTVWIYVDTNKEVGDVDHLRVFANPDLAMNGSKSTIQKVLCLSIRLSNDQARTLTASPKPRPILHEVAPPARSR